MLRRGHRVQRLGPQSEACDALCGVEKCECVCERESECVRVCVCMYVWVRVCVCVRESV